MAVVPPIMSSDEVNLLIYAYLIESSLAHSAFALYNESRLTDFVTGDEGGPSIPPSGQLIRILQKGLLYLQAEAKYRGEDVRTNPPRLVGYAIADALPLPALPKTLPPPSPTTSSSTQHPGGNPYNQESPSTTEARSTLRGVSNEHEQPLEGRVPGIKRKAYTHSSDGAAGELSSTQPQASTSKRKDAEKEPRGRDSRSPVADSHNSTNNKRQKIADHRRSPSAASDRRPSPGAVTGSQADMKDKQQNTRKNDRARPPPVSAQEDSEMGDTSVQSETEGNVARRGRDSAHARNSKLVSTSTSSMTTNQDVRSKSQSTRRSTSPVASRLSLLAGNQEKARPRSTSPTVSRSSYASSTNARQGTKDGAMSLPTPTLDASNVDHHDSPFSPSTSSKTKPNSNPGESSANSPSNTPLHAMGKSKCLILRGHTNMTQPCDWNPKVENLLATGATDGTARIWDLSTITNDSQHSDHVVCKHSSGSRKNDVTCVQWNSEGTLLATGSEDGIARIWTPSGDLHLVLSMHQRTIFSIKWNSTGSMLLTGSLDHSICLWDTSYGKVKQQWSTHSDSVLDLDWLNDDIFASCAMDNNINIHQIGRTSPAYRFKGHADEVNCIRFDPGKNLLASCSDDKTVRIWLIAPVLAVLGLSLADVGASVTNESKSEEWATRSCVTLKGHRAEVHAIAWCPAQLSSGQPSLLASASFDSTARVWDIQSATCIHVINRHTDMVYSLAWQPDSGQHLATASNDKRLCITRIRDKQLLYEYEHRGNIYEICWHPSKNQIAMCGQTEVVSIAVLESLP